MDDLLDVDKYNASNRQMMSKPGLEWCGVSEDCPYCPMIRVSEKMSEYLVGGLEHVVYFPIYQEYTSLLTFIFFRRLETTNQIPISLFH